MIIAFTGAGISKASGVPTFSDFPEIRDKLTREFANEHPEEYKAVMKQFIALTENASPNEAHYSLAQYGIPVITMNVDQLHQMASASYGNSQCILPLHGRLPTREELDYCNLLTEAPVLYGDLAPNYSKIPMMLDKLRLGDTLLVIGASDYTNISLAIREEAREKGASIVEIQDNADVKVKQFLERRRYELSDDYLHNVFC